MTKYTVVSAGVEKKEVFYGLVQEIFSEQAAESRKAIWEWSTTDNPASKLIDPEVVILNKDDTPVGALYLVPARIYIDNKEICAHWVSSLMVKKSSRGKGLLLVRYIVSKEIPLMGFPLDRLINMYRRHNSHVVLETEQLFYLVRPGQWLANKYPVCMPLAPAMNFIWGLALNSIKLAYRYPKGFRVKEITYFNSEFDVFWNAVSPSYRGLTVRDSLYLNWRFSKCPLHLYRIYACFYNDRLSGYVVCRTGKYNGLAQGYLVDLLVANGDVNSLGVLVKTAISSFKKNNVIKISMMKAISSRWIKMALQKQGFMFSKPHVKLIFGEIMRDIAKDSFSQENSSWVTYSDSDNDLSL